MQSMRLLFTPVLTTPLLKVPLLLSCGALNYVGFNPPQMGQPLRAQRKLAESSALFTRALPYVMLIAKLTGTALLGLTATEAAVILAQLVPDSTFSHAVLSLLIPASLPKPLALDITPRFLIGSILTIAGGAFRAWSYWELGRSFTVDLRLHDDHKLVTTGPYAYVRHPSYLGVIVLMAGDIVGLLGRGSYLRETGIHHSIAGRASVGAFFAWALAVTAVLTPQRMAREDAILREEYGEEWEAYAKRTPYKLIPYVW